MESFRLTLEPLFGRRLTDQDILDLHPHAERRLLLDLIDDAELTRSANRLRMCPPVHALRRGQVLRETKKRRVDPEHAWTQSALKGLGCRQIRFRLGEGKRDG